jgi:hypothetical protein
MAGLAVLPRSLLLNGPRVEIQIRPQTELHDHWCPRPQSLTASLDRSIPVRLLHVYAVVGDSIFGPVLDIERVASVSRIVQRVIECVSRPLYSDFDYPISRLNRGNTAFPDLVSREGAGYSS